MTSKSVWTDNYLGLRCAQYAPSLVDGCNRVWHLGAAAAKCSPASPFCTVFQVPEALHGRSLQRLVQIAGIPFEVCPTHDRHQWRNLSSASGRRLHRRSSSPVVVPVQLLIHRPSDARLTPGKRQCPRRRQGRWPVEKSAGLL